MRRGIGRRAGWVVLAAVAAGLAACGAGTSASHPPAAVDAVPADQPRPPAHSGDVLPTGATLVATTHGAIPGFVRPGGPSTGTVPGSWQGAPSILPVTGSRPGWYDVRLAQRPNGSTVWVLARDVSVAVTPYRIVIDLATTHLALWRSGHLVLSVPIGIGTARYPTPTGHFFVALLAMAPSPGYGAFVMVTSAHSDTITDWDRSGDAIVAIHGPLGSDRQIGTTGAAVSHGCIRLHEADLLRLRIVPVGSPVDIEAG
jgi:lipoprotein-anchoring transpeptidase ErfK/SrfK